MLNQKFANDGALIFGENGVGKTNILEAIHFIALGRSQRAASKKEMIHAKYTDAYVRGTFIKNEKPSSLSIGMSRDKKIILKKNDKKLRFFSEILHHARVVSFGPQDIQLVYGDPSERRKFMDIILSQIDMTYLENLIRYRNHVLNRNKLLQSKVMDRSIEIYEERIAECGSYVWTSRMEFLTTISSVFTEYYNWIVDKKINGSIHYKSFLTYGETDRERVKQLLVSSLKNQRKKDFDIGYTTIGPHRDDFQFFINNYQSKSFGSHGQCRALAIALKLCSLFYFEKKMSEKIIILADDIFNELDSRKVENIYELMKNRGQLFLTSLSCSDTLFKDLPLFEIKNNAMKEL